MTDSAIIGLIAEVIHDRAIASLMAGNDAGCFSTQQYVEAWYKANAEVFHKASDTYGPMRFSEKEAKARARKRLHAFRAKEVKPDVWIL